MLATGLNFHVPAKLENHRIIELKVEHILETLECISYIFKDGKWRLSKAQVAQYELILMLELELQSEPFLQYKGIDNFIMLYFIGLHRQYMFCKLKVCGNLASYKSISTIFFNSM